MAEELLGGLFPRPSVCVLAGEELSGLPGQIVRALAAGAPFLGYRGAPERVLAVSTLPAPEPGWLRLPPGSGLFRGHGEKTEQFALLRKKALSLAPSFIMIEEAPLVLGPELDREPETGILVYAALRELAPVLLLCGSAEPFASLPLSFFRSHSPLLLTWHRAARVLDLEAPPLCRRRSLRLEPAENGWTPYPFQDRFGSLRADRLWESQAGSPQMAGYRPALAAVLSAVVWEGESPALAPNRKYPEEPDNERHGAEAETLLEHALDAAELAAQRAAAEGVPLPLALIAALGHDIGKAPRFTPSRRTFRVHQRMGGAALGELLDGLLPAAELWEVMEAVARHHESDAGCGLAALVASVERELEPEQALAPPPPTRHLLRLAFDAEELVAELALFLGQKNGKNRFCSIIGPTAFFSIQLVLDALERCGLRHGQGFGAFSWRDRMLLLRVASARLADRGILDTNLLPPGHPYRPFLVEFFNARVVEIFLVPLVSAAFAEAGRGNALRVTPLALPEQDQPRLAAQDGQTRRPNPPGERCATGQ